jgi:hypothetical protein
MSTLSGGPNIVVDGLVLALDAANTKSYISGSTIWRDLSRNNNNGTLINGPTFNPNNGGSIVFDGIDDFINCGSNNIINTGNAFTVGFWVNMNLMPSNVTSPITIKSNANDFLILISSRLGYEGISIGSGGTWAQGRTGTISSFFLQQWVYITVTYNGTGTSTLSNFNIYENAVNKTLTPGTPGLISQSTSTIIGFINSGNTLNGKISNFTIYNRALSAQEVLQNYNATKTRFGL